MGALYKCFVCRGSGLKGQRLGGVSVLEGPTITLKGRLRLLGQYNRYSSY